MELGETARAVKFWVGRGEGACEGAGRGLGDAGRREAGGQGGQGQRILVIRIGSRQALGQGCQAQWPAVIFEQQQALTSPRQVAVGLVSLSNHHPVAIFIQII